MSLTFRISNDGRIITDAYQKDGKTRFSLAEKTSKGTLITEFDEHSEVVNQVYKEGHDHEGALLEYLKADGKKIVLSGDYRGIVINAKCSGCGSVGLARSLDLASPSDIKEVPVVPLFVCRECKRVHYSLTDDYLAALVDGKKELFEKDELEQINCNKSGSVKLLQEYIIRIFASKKISRIKIE